MAISKTLWKSVQWIMRWSGVIYLSFIPIFAFIYFMIPAEFYHSTLKYEPSFQQDENAILRDLKEAFIVQFKKVNGEEVIRESADSLTYFDINDIEMKSLTYEDGVFTFKVYATYKEITGIGAITIGHVAKFLGDPVTPRDSPKIWMTFYISREIIEFPKIEFPRTLLRKEKRADFFLEALIPGEISETWHPAWAGNKLIEITMTLPKHLMNRLDAYADKNQGIIRNRSRETFVRMLYMSIEIITTLGLGDIVPVTTRARTIVFFESSIGILLIGLYLNHLSRQKV